MKKFIDWLKSPLGIGMRTTVVGFLLTVSYDLLKDKPVLSTIFSILLAIWKFVLAFLNFELKVWWILLGIIVLLAILYIVIEIYEAKNSDNNELAFVKYIKDYISGWYWEWQWEKGYDGKYSVENLHPICPKCSTPLVKKGLYATCLRCNFTTNKELPEFNHIKLIIYDNTKRNLNSEIDTQ